VRLTRREILAGLLASAPLVAYGQGVARPPARAGRVTPPLSLSQIFGNSGLGRNSGCVLLDLGDGRMLEGHNPGLARPPASVTKTMTALYAQSRLGNDYRFETRLLANGAITDGVLNGDLYLVGGGDPELDTDDLDTLVQQAFAAGLRRVAGRFYVVSNALPLIAQIDPAQPLQAGYSPAVAGLNLNFNRVYFEWKRETGGYRVTMDARSARLRPAINSAQMRVVQRAGPVYGYEQSGGVERWSVARGALGKSGGRWLPVRDPAVYAAEVLGLLAQARGLVLPPAQKHMQDPRGAVLARVVSDDLRTIQRDMLRYSTNLTAEVLGLTATKAAGGNIDSLRVSAQSMGRWVARRSRGSTPELFNHSGLNEGSRVTAREMALFLSRAPSRSGLAGLLREAVVQNGRGDAIDLPGIKIFAKSGTLDFTRGLAGYIKKDGQSRYAFAIFAADLPARRAMPRGQEHPPGARRWRGVAKAQEKALLYRWASAL